MKNYFLSLILFTMTFRVPNVAAQETVITFTLGSFQVSTLSEGLNKGNSNLLTGINEDMLKKYLPDGTFPLETNAFLVRTNDKTVLIDAGYGKNLFNNLHSLNVGEEQVDVILLTHMHRDHIGGLLRDGKVMFPNADLYVSQAEHDYWMKTGNEQARNVFAAYKEKLHLFVPAELGKETKELFPGIRGIAAYGHTPGHTAYLLESEGKKLLIWGDLTHATVIQMPHPEVTLTFDVDAAMAKETRQKILEYVAKNKIPIGGMHIVFPSIGNINAGNANDAAYLFDPYCTCEGI